MVRLYTALNSNASLLDLMQLLTVRLAIHLSSSAAAAA